MDIQMRGGGGRRRGRRGRTAAFPVYGMNTDSFIRSIIWVGDDSYTVDRSVYCEDRGLSVIRKVMTADNKILVR